jgi:hypothetical protein
LKDSKPPLKIDKLGQLHSSRPKYKNTAIVSNSTMSGRNAMDAGASFATDVTTSAESVPNRGVAVACFDAVIDGSTRLAGAVAPARPSAPVSCDEAFIKVPFFSPQG